MQIPEQATVSAIVITLNEEENLQRCLNSLSWVDELIVVDAGSRDRTLEIALAFNARIYHRDWTGYADQRAFALAKAGSEWVISLDADEELSAPLISEIRSRILHGSAKESGLLIPRRCRYLGRWIYHGEWFPDLQLRLFRRDRACLRQKHVHESFEVKGEVETLEGLINHYSFNGVGDHLCRMRKYAGLVALQRFEDGVRWNLRDHLTEPVRRAYGNLVTRRGYRDGYRGLIITMIIFYYAYRTHSQLLGLQKQS